MERTVRRSMRLAKQQRREETEIAYRKEQGQDERGRGDGTITRS